MAAPNLTRTDAQTRAEMLEVDSYTIALDLTDGAAAPGETTFRSTTTVRFRSRQPGAATWIDIVAAGVRSATLNGIALDVSGYDEEKGIALPDLAADNELVVDADCRYMNTGEGLHRFVDPVDGGVYLYSQFETADAKRMFACFDQPDLKATITLTALAAPDWQVVSNGAPDTTTTLDTGAVHHAFETTVRISTYLVALIAGPYAVWRDEYSDEYGTIPLGIFCRTSLAEHMDAERLFTETKQGFGFYHRNFGVAYPFGKYDQLFVPEFNAGAMENVGAVTFLEDYVFRSRVTRYLYERRAETVLHEMAHMWFGDLVTMRWWDDLWLNESFATWASVVSQAEATEYTQRLDDVRERREVLGLPPGPAALHAPDRRRHPRPAGRRGQLRRHHLRQGRVGAQAARGLRRAGGVPRRAAAVLRPPRLGQRHVRRPARGAQGGLRARPVRLGRAVAPHHRAQLAAPRRSPSTPTAATRASTSCRAARRPVPASCARTGSRSGVYDDEARPPRAPPPHRARRRGRAHRGPGAGRGRGRRARAGQRRRPHLLRAAPRPSARWPR